MRLARAFRHESKLLAASRSLNKERSESLGKNADAVDKLVIGKLAVVVDVERCLLRHQAGDHFYELTGLLVDHVSNRLSATRFPCMKHITQEVLLELVLAALW